MTCFETSVYVFRAKKGKKDVTEHCLGAYTEKEGVNEETRPGSMYWQTKFPPSLKSKLFRIKKD